MLLPLWTSVLVRTYAWMVLLGRNGVFNRWLIEAGVISDPLPLLHNFNGVLIGMVHVLLPYMVLPIYGAVRRLDPALVAAAEGLGASNWRIFWRIYLPLTLPGIFAGAVIVFVLSLGFYITPALLGGGKVMMVAVMIEQEVRQTLNWPFAAALSAVLLALTLGVYTVAQRLHPAGGAAMSRRALVVACAAIYLFLMLPLLVVFPISLSSAPYMQFPPPGYSTQWYERYLDDPQWIDATVRSLYIGAATAVLALALGVPLAFSLARGKFIGRALLDRIALAPLVVPTIILSVGLYGLFAKLKLIGEWYGLVLAHTVLALPFVVLVIVRRPARFRSCARAGGRGAGRQPREDPSAGHPAAVAAEPGVRRPAGLHLVVRRAGRRAVPGRAEHDLAQEDVRQHPDGDRSDDRRGVGDADPAGLDRARPDRPFRAGTERQRALGEHHGRQRLPQGLQEHAVVVGMVASLQRAEPGPAAQDRRAGGRRGLRRPVDGTWSWRAPAST